MELQTALLCCRIFVSCEHRFQLFFFPLIQQIYINYLLGTWNCSWNKKEWCAHAHTSTHPHTPMNQGKVFSTVSKMLPVHVPHRVPGLYSPLQTQFQIPAIQILGSSNQIPATHRGDQTNFLAPVSSPRHCGHLGNELVGGNILFSPLPPPVLRERERGERDLCIK